MINKISRWIINEGCNNSYGGSWCISLDEIKKEFGVELSNTQIEEVMKCLIFENEIAYVTFIEDEFYFVLYLSYVKKNKKN